MRENQCDTDWNDRGGPLLGRLQILELPAPFPVVHARGDPLERGAAWAKESAVCARLLRIPSLALCPNSTLRRSALL